GIPTGGALRADELAYDPDHHLILIGDDQESPPLLAIISTTQLKTIKTIPLPGSQGLGAEQPIYDPIQRVFLMTLPTTAANPGGEVIVVDPVALAITKIYPLTACNPNGIAIGPNEQVLLGCG